MVARAIVNYGVYQFTEQQRSQRIVRMTSQVEKKPENEFLNAKFQKMQSFYGYAQLMIGNWVCSTIQLQYEFEQIFSWENWTAQHEIFHYCTQLNNAVNLSTVASQLGAPGLVFEGEPITIALMPYDRVVFKLYSNTTLLIEVSTEPFINRCSAPVELVDEPPLAEPSSRAVEPNPLDNPYDIPDPPYDLPTADNNETYNPQVPPEEQGEAGRIYNLDGRFTANDRRSGAVVAVLSFASVTAPYYPPVLFQAEQRSNGSWYWGVRIQHAGGLFEFVAFSNGEGANEVTQFTMEYLTFTPRP